MRKDYPIEEEFPWEREEKTPEKQRPPVYPLMEVPNKRHETVILTRRAGGLKGAKMTAGDRKKAKAIVAPVKRARKAFVKAQRVAIKKQKALVISIKKRATGRKRATGTRRKPRIY